MEHAKEAISISDSVFSHLFEDKSGTKDFSRSQNGSGMSSRSKWKRFISELNRQGQIRSKRVFSVEEMKEVASTLEISTFSFMEFIDNLNNQGFLIKKGKGLYQIQTM